MRRPRTHALIVSALVGSLFAVVLVAVDQGDRPAAADSRPNVVVVLTDDQVFDLIDPKEDPTSPGTVCAPTMTLPTAAAETCTFRAAMPFLFQQLYPHPSVPGQSAGDWVIFKNAIMDNSQCCPARTSLLTGQRARNTGVTTNFCAPYFEPVTPTTEPQCNVSVTSDSTIARRLHDSGYRTAMLGKYLNDFPWDLSSNYIPSGWDDWSTTFAQGGGAYFNYRLQTKTGPGPNDVLIDPAGARQAQPCENQPNVPDTCLPGQANYLTDLLRDRAVNFINTSSEPFFLYMAPTAPHRAENGLQSGRADASASPWALAPPRYRDYRIPLPATSCCGPPECRRGFCRRWVSA